MPPSVRSACRRCQARRPDGDDWLLLDLALAQSGIHFDPLRGGEGHFLERIVGGPALVFTFSYWLGGGMA